MKSCVSFVLRLLKIREYFFFDEINIVIYWNMINYFHYITLIDYLYVKLYIKILKAVNLINFNSTVLLRLRIINNQSYCYFYSNIYFCISYICIVVLLCCKIEKIAINVYNF